MLIPFAISSPPLGGVDGAELACVRRGLKRLRRPEQRTGIAEPAALQCVPLPAPTPAELQLRVCSYLEACSYDLLNFSLSGPRLLEASNFLNVPLLSINIQFCYIFYFYIEEYFCGFPNSLVRLLFLII